MKKTIALIFLAGALLVSCTPKKENTADKKCCKTDSSCCANEHLVMGVLYSQKAAEFRALTYQAYTLAGMMLEKNLADKAIKQKRAVVLDIDETVLDNSPYEAKCAAEGIGYPEKWDDWCNLAKAKAIPGVVDFLKYADSKGVDIYYVTNRKENLKDATIKNLKETGCPQADEKHLMLRVEENSKEGRRQEIMKTHYIALLIGDNLADFAVAFDGKLSTEKRAQLTDSLKAEFGRRFIVLPNAMYGDWEGAIYDWDYKKSAAEKKKIRHEKLEKF
ncbi:MAG: 5'-nucleotidase, lipoprotein e(P4) family [Bacteroidota bacterium]